MSGDKPDSESRRNFLSATQKLALGGAGVVTLASAGIGTIDGMQKEAKERYPATQMPESADTTRKILTDAGIIGGVFITPDVVVDATSQHPRRAALKLIGTGILSGVAYKAGRELGADTIDSIYNNTGNTGGHNNPITGDAIQQQAGWRERTIAAAVPDISAEAPPKGRS